MNDLAAYLARALGVRKARKKRRKAKPASADGLRKARRIGIVGKYLKDRQGRAGFYYVKNERGKAVLYWKSR